MKDPRFLSRHNIRVNVPLHPFAAVGTGGNADFFVEIATLEPLTKVLAAAAENDLRVVVIGAGTSSVFSDHGVRGLVVKVALKDIDYRPSEVIVGAGMPVNELTHKLSGQSCGGLEDFSGTVGTIGSAVRRNINGNRTSIGQRVISVSAYSKGRLITIGATDLELAINDSRLMRSGEVVAAVRLAVEKKPADDIKKALLSATQARLRHRPGARRAVRIFRDPLPELAADLSKQVGMAGERVGGAVVSSKDANYIINDGTAKSSDIYELAQQIKHRVSLKLGRKLVEDVSWLGEW